MISKTLCFMRQAILSPVFPIIALIIIFGVPNACFPADNPTGDPKNFKFVQVFPPKEDFSKAPAGLGEAINKIKKAVKEKNVESLLKYIADDVKTDFGGGSGKKDFIKMWELDKNPEKSRVWKELENIFTLGGGYKAGENWYSAPYTFNAETGGLDSFEYYIVTGKGVNVRKTPSSKSEVVKKIDFEVVYVHYNENETAEEINGESYPWKKVILSNGEQGYIYGKYLRSPVDFRFSIEKIKEDWKIVYFLCGD